MAMQFTRKPLPPGKKTDVICNHVTKRLLRQSQGLQFIGGDFNQPDGALDNMTQWADAGWVNVQSWACQKLGKAIQVTCKQKTTKDHLYVSPQLAMYLKDVEVQHDWFADHSILIARFYPLGSPPLLPLWKHPAAIDWNAVDKTEVEAKFEPPPGEADPTLHYAALMQKVESAVDQARKAKGKGALPKSMRGRGQQLEVVWVQEHSAPIKKSREGEFQPSFHGLNQQHCRWVRQYRRLVNYARLVQDFKGTPSAINHREQLWHSIMSATGFAPSFAEWVVEQGNKIRPPPWEPPNHELATEVCQVFHRLLIAFEKQLNAQRSTEAKQRRQDDPVVIFQDLRDEKPLPVQMLVDHKQAAITELDFEESAVIMHKDIQWDTAQPVRSDTNSFGIIAAEESKIWLDSLDNLAPGMTLEQEKYIGKLPEMFAKFGEEWRARWDRHYHVDPDRWDPIVQFADLALPRPPPMQYSPITKEEWTKALKSKRKKAATGPDGVSRQDLLNLPDQATEALLEMFAGIEAGNQWPRQLVLGIVAALAKIPSASQTKHFRPITILPVAFRTWSSIRARQILTHLQPYAPPTCAGSVPGRQAADIWYHIMAQIEVAQYAQMDLTGGVVDLEKAFNMLPRVPILEFMRILNVAPQILVAWSKALVSLERRFTIHQCVGPPLKSTSGFAEGCSLSVTSMLAANIVVHQYMLRRYPAAMLWTFVDNWELTGPNADAVLRALDGLHALCHAMDMVIDDSKSYTWSVSATQRKQLRDQNLQVKLAARDLGGHVQYSQVVTNSSITDRCEKIKKVWGRLARSLAPYRQKVQALRTKAWASCLHGVASVHLGEDHFQRLRTGAVQGLGEHSPGVSPPVHLSLVETVHADPQFHALYVTVIMFRAMFPHEDVAAFCLAELHLPRKTVVPRPGPVSVLLARLHQISWSWSHGCLFFDHMMRVIDLVNCPIQELNARLAQAWQQRIQGQAAERKTMQGMQWMSPLLTTCTMKHKDPQQQALLRTCLNGTFFTADRLKHHEKNKGVEGTDLCKFCHQPDSQVHRQWLCPHFAAVRTLAQEQVDGILALPMSVAAHGWMPEPPSVPKFQQSCLQIADEHLDFVYPPTIPAFLEVFTDGGCLAPTSPLGKLASWGVVIGDVVSQRFWPLSNGLVPGWVQTALRGELWAAISAMKFAILQRCQIRIWCDNHTVVKRLGKFSTQKVKIKPNATNADLWRLAQQLVHQLGQSLQIVKVSSHQDPHTAQDEAEAWLFAGNEAADKLAQTAFCRHGHIYQEWTQLHRDLDAIHIMRNRVHDTMIAVAQVAVQSQVPTGGAHDRQHANRIDAQEVRAVDFSSLIDESFAESYQCEEASKIAEWLQTVCDQDAPVQAVSWFQLNALYEYQTNAKGVKYNKSRKTWEDAAGNTKSTDFVARTKSFSKWVQGALASQSKPIQPLHLRPASSILQFWTMCVPLCMKQELLTATDEVFQSSAPRLTTVRSLRCL